MLVRIKVARTFAPHVLLLRAASRALESARAKTEGRWWDWLASIIYSSLSIEAIGNTYGETFIAQWKKFKSSPPLKKIRLVAEHCKLQPDFGSEPWSIVPELISFRNEIAHPKLKKLSVNKTYSQEEYEKYLYSKPESKLESKVTEHFAQRSQDCINEILRLLGRSLPEDAVMQIETESWEGGAEIDQSQQ